MYVASVYAATVKEELAFGPSLKLVGAMFQIFQEGARARAVRGRARNSREQWVSWLIGRYMR